MDKIERLEERVSRLSDSIYYLSNELHRESYSNYVEMLVKLLEAPTRNNHLTDLQFRAMECVVVRMESELKEREIKQDKN